MQADIARRYVLISLRLYHVPLQILHARRVRDGLRRIIPSPHAR